MTSYWIKDQTRKEIITKTQIPNKGNFGIYANYYNLIDAKGIGFLLSSTSDLQVERLYQKNGFEYFVLEQKKQKELHILPHESIEKLANRIISKLDFCNTEKDVVSLLIGEMY